MLFQVLKKGNKTYYMEYGNSKKRHIINNNAKRITPDVDQVNVVDGLFLISDGIQIPCQLHYMNETIEATLYLYINTDGMPASPCFISCFPDVMYTIPVKTSQEFLDCYQEFKDDICSQIADGIESKFERTEATCLQLAKLDKKSKSKRGKKK